jgi:hypothetical protein
MRDLNGTQCVNHSVNEIFKINFEWHFYFKMEICLQLSYIIMSFNPQQSTNMNVNKIC